MNDELNLPEVAPDKPALFSVGDEVAWSHEVTIHATGSILRKDALPNDAIVGKVVGVANDEGTWFEVECEDGETRVLTAEELVKVADA